MIYRRYSAPKIWEEMNRMQREFDRMASAFSSDGDRVAASFPAMNAWTNENEEIVTAELPGVNPSDIEITFAPPLIAHSMPSKSHWDSPPPLSLSTFPISARPTPLATPIRSLEAGSRPKIVPAQCVP